MPAETVVNQTLVARKSSATERTGPQLSSAATEQMEADALKTTRALGRQLVIAMVDKA
jgi:hypothetical protein